MKRKSISYQFLLVVLLAIGCVSQVWGTIITIDSNTVPDGTATYDLTALGTLDWVVATNPDWSHFGDEKAGGTAIQTVNDPGNYGQLASTFDNGGLSTFTFTDGDPASATGASFTGIGRNWHNGVNPISFDINLLAGSGTITTWAAPWSVDTSFIATFADLTTTGSTSLGASGEHMVVLSYDTAVAQTLNITLGGGSIRAVAVSAVPVPEPASFALVVLGGLLIWQQRRR